MNLKDKNNSFHNSKNSKDSKNKSNILALSKNNSNNELSLTKGKKSSENFLLNRKRLLNLNEKSKSESFGKLDLSIKNSNKNSFKSRKSIDSYNNYDDDYNYDSESFDNVEKEQKDLLEAMFIEAKYNDKENKDKKQYFLDIINSDETKEKIWSYKSYEEICLIELNSEEHESFIIYYKKLIETAHLLKESDITTYIKYTTEQFVNIIIKKSKESINHWLEDITKDFNIFQKDKIINIFEANINLNFLLLVNQSKKKKDKKNNEENSQNNIDLDVNVIEYMQDKQKLEELTIKYLIEECGCDPQYLDSKGNTYFYYSPSISIRGGQQYNVPLGWTAFGIEVLNRYGNSDWLAADGRNGEWVVAYHGFGGRMRGMELKNIIKTIIHDNLKPGSGQSYSYDNDKRHPGKKCGNGVYITPNINIALGYAGIIPLGNKTYNIVIMVRANPKFIREPQSMPDYWIIDGKSNQLRPYRLLIKECNNFNMYY